LRVVTWNVNSIRARLERVQAFLARWQPDVLALQETKVADAEFPAETLRAAGYEVQAYGQRTYNGVALLARVPLADLTCGFDDDGPEAERRLIAATAGGLRIVNVYVPNGQAVDSPKYAYKLAWLARLRCFLEAELRAHPDLVVLGDFNVAPEDRDVHDPELWRGQVLCSEPERDAIRALFALGLSDLQREFSAEPGFHTWWDYRGLAFPMKKGLRIDLVLVSEGSRARALSIAVDREERKGKGASDHAPVIVDFAP
jgi:exodeoxyribonuclease-3